MKYMICVDESETADTAFEWLLDVARPEKDEVHLFCAIEPKYAYASMGTPGHETYVDKALYVQQKKAEVLLEKFLKRLGDLGIKSTSSILSGGDAKTVVPQKVKELEIGTLVLGSRGLNALERWILGSFSDYCIKNVNCAVVVVKTGADLHLAPKPASV